MATPQQRAYRRLTDRMRRLNETRQNAINEDRGRQTSNRRESIRNRLREDPERSDYFQRLQQRRQQEKEQEEFRRELNSQIVAGLNQIGDDTYSMDPKKQLMNRPMTTAARMQSYMNDLKRQNEENNLRANQSPASQRDQDELDREEENNRISLSRPSQQQAQQEDQPDDDWMNRTQEGARNTNEPAAQTPRQTGARNHYQEEQEAQRQSAATNPIEAEETPTQSGAQHTYDPLEGYEREIGNAPYTEEARQMMARANMRRDLGLPNVRREELTQGNRNDQNTVSQIEYDTWLANLRNDKRKEAKGFGANLDYGTWLGSQTREVRDALRLSNAQQHLADEKAQVEAGLFNGTGAYEYYNDYGLVSEKEELKKKKLEAEQELERLQAERESNQENSDNWAPEESLNTAGGIYDELSQNGNLYFWFGNRDSFVNGVRNFINKYNDNDIAFHSDDQSKQARRETIINEVLGDFGAYDMITENMTDDEKVRLDEQLDSLLNNMFNPYDYDTEIRNTQQYIQAYENKIKQIENHQKWRSQYKQEMLKAAGDSDGAFHQEMDNGQTEWNTYADLFGGNAQNYTNPTADNIYSFINGGQEYQLFIENGGDNVPQGYKHAAMMMPDEIEAFNRYYNAGKKDEAMAFLDGINPILNQRYSYYRDIQIEDLAHRAPVIASVASVGATVLQPSEFLMRILGRVVGDKATEDQNSKYYAASAFKRLARQDVAEQMGEVEKFLYNAGMSAADCFINTAMGQTMGLSGAALEAGTLILFGTEAFQSSMEQNLRETKGDYRASFIGSAVDAIIETATEIWSVENLLSDPQEFIKYIAKCAFSEASEEFVGEAFGPAFERLITGTNQWNDMLNEILVEGGYTDESGNWVPIGKNEEDMDKAMRHVLKEWNHSILMSTLAGATSSLISIPVGGSRNAYSYTKTGQAVRGANVAEGTGTDALLNAAMEMDENSESYQRANKLKSKGGNISAYQLGKLAQSMMRESSEKLSSAAQSVVQRKAFEMLGEETGTSTTAETKEQDTRETAQGVTGTTTEQETAETAERETGTTTKQETEETTTERGSGTTTGEPEKESVTENSGSGVDWNKYGRYNTVNEKGETVSPTVRPMESGSESSEKTESAGTTVSEEDKKGPVNRDEQPLDPEEQMELSKLIAKAVAGGGVRSLNKNERKALFSSQRAMGVFLKFMTANETSTQLRGEVMDATKKDADIYNSVSDLLQINKKNKTAQAEQDKEVSDWMASKDEQRHATGKRTGSIRDVIVDGEYGQVTGAEAEKDSSGKRTGEVLFRVTVNGQQRTVKAEQVRSMDYGTAAIVREAAVNPGLYSAEFVDNLMKAKDRGTVKNVGVLMEEARRLRLAAYTGQAMPMTRMDRNTAIEIYNGSLKEHAANRKAQTHADQRNAGRPGAGRATFNGIEYGTKEWDKQLEDKKLSKSVRKQMNAIGAIAQRAGIEVTLLDEQGMKEALELRGVKTDEISGWYGFEEGGKDAKSNGISINVDGLDYGWIRSDKDGKLEKGPVGAHHMLVTFGHEMTHWLQRNSMKGYNRLEQFVMGELARTVGTANLNKRITDVMQNRNLDLEGAISEIVADSCDQILANEEVQKRIESTDKTLTGEIKNFVKDLVARVKDAIKGMNQSASREAIAIKYAANRLAKVWMGAYDEALTGWIAQDENVMLREAMDNFAQEEKDLLQDALDNPQPRFSMRAPIEVRDDGLVAVHNLGMLSIDKVIKMGGFPMPSIAVMSDRVPWTGYGPVSIFFGREMVDPAYEGNDMYTGDAYTPTLGDSKPTTAEEALEYLRSKPKRDLSQANNSLTLLFRQFKKVTSLEEARKRSRVSFTVDAAQRSREYNQLKTWEVQILQEARAQYKAKNGRSMKYGQEMALPVGILLASEELDTKSDLTTEQKYEIIQRNISESMSKGRTDDLDLSGNTSIYDKILQFIELANRQVSGDNMSEAKPDRIIPMSEIKAVLLPDGMLTKRTIKALREAGVDKHIIYTYEEGNDSARRKALLDIPNRAPGVRFSRAEENIGQYKTFEIRDGQMIQTDSLGDETVLTGADREYVEAWQRGDFNRMEEVLMDKIRENGAIPFKAPESYNNREHQWISNQIKEKNMDAIQRAAVEMAGLVPKNAVLVPMPNRHGRVDADTDTMLLAREISKITGSPVINALAGVERESRQADKGKKKSEQMTVEDLGFRQVAEIPEGKVPYFVDNVIASGLTAEAAHRALGNNGVTLAFTKSNRTANAGLKRATITFYDQLQNQRYGQYLIPLSERVDMDKIGYTGAKFSKVLNSFGLEPLNNDVKNNIIARGDVFVETGKELLDAINEARTNPNDKRNVFIGLISENTKRILSREAKRNDLFKKGEYIFGFNSDQVRHFDKHFVTDEEIAYALYDAYRMLIVNDSVKAETDKAGRTIIEIIYNNNVFELTSVLEASKARKSITTKTIYLTMGTIKNWQAVNRHAMLRTIHSSAKTTTSNKSIQQSGGTGKTKFSAAELNRQYDNALKSGNTEEQQRLVDEAAEMALADSQVRDRKGKLVKVYHGTSADFNVFDTSVSGGSHGTAEGYGIYLSDNKEISDKYGERLIAGYANAKRLARHDRVTFKKRELVSLIRETCEKEAREVVENDPDYSMNDALRDTWISNYVYTPEYRTINDAYAAVADIILKQESSDMSIIQELMAGNAIRDYDAAMDFYHNILTPVTGFDGYWTQWKDADGKVAGNIYLVFDSSQIKSAEPITRDDDGNVIPLSERFNTGRKDIRYSRITDNDGNTLAEVSESGTVSKYSRSSWTEREIKSVRNKLMKGGFATDDIDGWISDVNSVGAFIAEHADVLDFKPDRKMKFKKPNGDVYKWTLDASTLCAKRLWYQGTFNAIQRQLPNTPLRPGDLIELANMMRDMGYQTPCGVCYVESRRRKAGDFTEEFVQSYAKKHKGEFIPTIADLTTSDGLYRLRDEHPEAYRAYIAANNKRGSGSIKPVQTRTDYRGDVRGMKKETIQYLKSIGGLRIQSFSDFETPHLMDMMQAVLDMAAVHLTSQAYTKVPNFAWVFGDTGIKINLSLMGEGTGVDENGNLVFSSKEGMDFAEAMKLRKRYGKNVGTILVGMNDAHILAAMADDRIDFIIPFHKSGWSQEDMARMKSMANYVDYQDYQNERTLEGYYKNGNPIYKNVDQNLEPVGPNGYWDFSKTGKENAERYLELCKENGIIPKFNNFLVDNGDGSYSLQPDGSTDGYWKTLIDFKMYDNEGRGAPQQEVMPKINMTEAMRVLEEFDGTGVSSLPVAEDVVKRYVEEYKAKHPNVARFSRATSENMDVSAWMAGLTDSSVQTEDERTLIKAYNDLRMTISLCIKRQLDYKAGIKKLQAHADQLTPDQVKELQTLQLKLQQQQERQVQLEDDLYRITSSEGYAGLMYRQNRILSDFIYGKTQDQVRDAVEQMIKEVQKARGEIAKQAEELKKLAESEAVKTMRSYMSKTSLASAARTLKKEIGSSMSNKEIENRLAEMALKKAQGESIIDDARALVIDMANMLRGYQTDVMERMRGVTIVIGPDQQKEMKGNGQTLASIRAALRGTGIKVKYGDYSTLDTDAGPEGDLRRLLPEMPADIGENSADALDKFVTWAQSMRDTELGVRQEMTDIEMTAITAVALASTVTTEITNDPAAKKQIERLMKQVREISEKAGEAAEKMDELQQQMDQVVMAGTKAKGWTSVLQRDVRTAIDYYNKVAKLAAQEEKRKVKEVLIAQLKSDHARDMMQQRQKYEEKMKNDRKARDIAERNKIIRGQINTVAKRVRKRLLAETDRENIPEIAKPLARQMLKMLVQHDFVGYRHVLFADRKQLTETMHALDSYEKRDGNFDPDRDLAWLVVGEGDNADHEIEDKVYQDLMDIESGLLEYRTAEGNGNVTLADRREALLKVERAVAEIWSVIDARSNAEINGRKMLVTEIALQAQDDMEHSRFKGEWTGVIGRGIGAIKAFVVNGNMTPEYFFKNLRNKTLSRLYDEYHRAENRNGLEVGKAQRTIAEIAEKYGYGTWDQKKRYTFKLDKGGEVRLTLGEMMSLYATWQREVMNRAAINGPEVSFHLEVGGFYTEQEEQNKILGREIVRQRAHRLTNEDMDRIRKTMTREQINYVNDIVAYLSQDMSDLGNEASMRMYGIKKYNEKWYFPFEIWNGVKSVKSDAGVKGNTENRIANMSSSKRRVNNASNALVIRDFTQTAVKHIGQMINYNTFAPAIEFMNRVMNTQLKVEGEGEDSSTKRTLRAAFGEIYGREALKYFMDFQEDINGGVKRADRTIYDKLLSTFKKGAVAGSMSVALQQPLSYIRAGIMINPKYLTVAVNPIYWKGSRAEMEKYSGVAVIKRMGKFDMNFGQSAVDYMMPDAKESIGKKAYGKVSDLTTALPELMDMMTWTRMWTACKLEQKALHPEMDTKSDEFLETVAVRFNEVMRMTQVYDSVLVKSRNMRSTNYAMKGITSFMGEPTLTANVLADAVANAGEKGGKTRLAKAGAAFIVSAVVQALVKGIVGAGRSPDKKKTWDENVAYRFAYNFISEVNPFSLIPGYSDLIEALKKGETTDDAMGVIGKITTAIKTGVNALSGNGKSVYRDIEDSVGQLAQLFTNIPVKNLMRDARAIYNWMAEGTYADRDNSWAVIKNQTIDQYLTGDNLVGAINALMGDNGWQTKNTAYYQRIYDAMKAGDDERAEELKEYLMLGRGTKDTSIKKGINDLAKADKDLSETEKADWMIDEGSAKSGGDYTLKQLKKGEITEAEARSLLKKAYPDKDDNDIWWQVDRTVYARDHGVELKSASKYYRLEDAISNNKSDEIKDAVKVMTDHGVPEKSIKSWLSKEYKTAYLESSGADRTKLKDALTKAYKAIGMTGADAEKLIDGWVKQAKKNKK